MTTTGTVGGPPGGRAPQESDSEERNVESARAYSANVPDSWLEARFRGPKRPFGPGGRTSSRCSLERPFDHPRVDPADETEIASRDRVRPRPCG